MYLTSANSRLITQAELRLSTLLREGTTLRCSLIEYEFLILVSKHPTVFFTDHKLIIFFEHKNQTQTIFQLILVKFPNMHIVWTAGKSLALTDTISRNTPTEFLSQKTTFQIPQNKKLFLAKDETSTTLQCKYAVYTDVDQSQLNNLQPFPLYLDCQNIHYEIDLFGKSKI